MTKNLSTRQAHAWFTSPSTDSITIFNLNLNAMNPTPANTPSAASAASTPEGNTIPPSRSRAWCFTVNNYTEDDEKLVCLMTSAPIVKKFIYGYEVGDSGTHHIQGFIRFTYQTRFHTVKTLVPRAHWEPAKGSDDANYVYCSKDNDFRTNMSPPVEKITRESLIDLVKASYADVQWKSWQTSVMEFLSDQSTRTIFWVYEPTGNVGKSFLAKYLSCEPGTIICQGKAGDIFNQVNACISEGNLPKVVLCDIPRVTIDYVSYNALECLKNGLLYSGKYEGGKCIFPSPIVICFANERPNRHKLSSDRLKVFKIVNEVLCEQHL